MSIIVAISKVNDGNMLIRDDKLNPDVINNRKSFLKKNDIDISRTTKVSTVYNTDDYCRYIEVDKDKLGDGMIDVETFSSDALITKDLDHALFLPIADCIGAAIFDPINNTVMMTHLGRQSLEQNGGYKSIRHLIDNFKADPSKLLVWLTPAPGVESYPVFSLSNRSLKNITYEQLRSAGVLLKNINDNTADTSSDVEYFSHSEFLKGNRPNDGRFAIVIMMKKED